MIGKKFYLDSAENIDETPENAIEWFNTFQEAQEAAVRYAKDAPATIYYVRQVVQSSILLYTAQAELRMDTKVVNDPQ